MLLVLSVILSITTACKSDQPTIISRIDSNEIDNFLTFDHSIFPTIDPNIAEDTTLTTVVVYIINTLNKCLYSGFAHQN